MAWGFSGDSAAVQTDPLFFIVVESSVEGQSSPSRLAKYQH